MAYCHADELSKSQGREIMSEFHIYRLIAPDDINGNPRRGWFIVYPSGLHRWVEEGEDPYALRDELCLREDFPHGPGCPELVREIAQHAHTERWTVPVGVYKSARSCASQSRLPGLSRGTYEGDWIWA